MLGLALVSIIPIVILFVGMVVFKKPASILGPIALVVGIIIAFVAFDTSMLQFAITDGVLEAGRVVIMLWAAFTILEMEKKTGGMDVIKDSIKDITKDKRILLLIIAMGFVAFLEGAAGAGSPAAVAAPMLLGLGYSPMIAVIACLICDTFVVCWGAAGVTLTLGASPIADVVAIADINFWLGRTVSLLTIILPFILIWTIFKAKGFKGTFTNILVAGISFGGAIYLSTVVFDFGPEVVGIFAGVTTMIAVGITARLNKKSVPEEFKIAEIDEEKSNLNIPVWKAASPYISILILLPLVRNTVPMSILSRYGYLLWIGILLWVCCIIGSRLLNVKSTTLGKYAGDTFRRMIPAFISLGSLLTLARVMRWSGMMEPLAITLSEIAGPAYPIAALGIGTLGAFTAGTAATSNLMFNGLHVTAAQHIGNVAPLQAVIMQHLGASIGNMICVHNIVAVAATVGMLGKEGEILRKLLIPFIIVFIVTAIIGLLVTSGIA